MVSVSFFCGSAHPCRQGGHSVLVSVAPLRYGSSLQAGRPLDGDDCVVDMRGLIPAGREATPSRSRRRRSSRAHPCRQGGHSARKAWPSSRAGSSLQAGRPRVRVRGPVAQLRLIPAGREATPRSRPRRSSRRAHPCRQGGHSGPVPAGTGHAGSSLQAGRPHRGQHLGRGARGLIPAGREATCQDCRLYR